jgi:hypothetical protein
VAERSLQARSPRADLAERIRDPGFTPAVRDVDGLLELLAQEATSKGAERAILRVGPAAHSGVQRHLDVAVPPVRSLLIRLVGRLASQGWGEGVGILLAALTDPDAKTRRNAAIALGRIRGEHVENALLAAWDHDPRPEMRRSIAAALGKVGTERSGSLLRAALSAPDPELARIAQRATMMIDRTASRSDRGEIDPAVVPAQPTTVVLLARQGLEDLVVEEMSRGSGVANVRMSRPGQVAATLSGPLSSLFQARSMLAIRFPLPSQWLRDADTVAEAVARVVLGPEARAILQTWTRGPVRYRIAWAGAGHRRAATWDVARTISEREPGYVNDPTLSTWEVVVTQDGRQVDVALAPRAMHDPRFSWRVADVPASSHPTVAAALVRVAGARPDDVVWDPFVGAGAELIERGLLGPFRSLFGSDMDPRALVAARKNLSAAGFEARLEMGDALAVAPEGVTLIVTNPPMGRRSSRNETLGETLSRFVGHAASILRPKGRLVWMAPWPERARADGNQAGLHLVSARTVDLGGFQVELQHWVKS